MSKICRNSRMTAALIRKPLAASTLLALLSMPAHAAMVTFILGDHPDAQFYNPAAADPDPYGIRADHIGTTYSVGDNLLGSIGGPVYLSWDPDLVTSTTVPSAATATIEGWVRDNLDGSSDAATSYWLSYTMTGLLDATTGGNVGFIATDAANSAGSIALTPGGTTVYSWTGQTNGAGYIFEFIADAHRLNSSGFFDCSGVSPPAACVLATDAYVGRGWLTGNGEFNDFLVTAQVVPLPAALWLLISGVGALFGFRGLSRRRAAAQ